MKADHDHLFEEVQLNPTPTPTPTPTIFSSKLHSPSLTTLQQQLVLRHHFPTECPNTSEEEEEESRSSGGPTGGPLITRLKATEGHSGGSTGGGGDGASVEVSRRPRGRPPGSKNKTKPPIIITREGECAMRPHVLEISSGLDIIDSIACFARKRNVGLCVLTASGSVVNVSLRQVSTTPGATVTFHGRFEILSMSATYLPPSSSSSGSLPSSNGCTISLAGPQGQIFGGSVVGALIAATNVFMVATSFTSPTYHRLPIEEEVDTQVQVAAPSTGGGGGGAGVDSHSHSTPSDSANAMTMYNCAHLPTDVIWTPTARPPQSQHF